MSRSWRRVSLKTSTYLSALDSDEQATGKLYVQKAAQAADEAWQQTIGGLHGPGVANPTIASLEHPSSASQDEDSDDMDFSAPRKSRLSAPQLQAQLSRLTDRSLLRRLKDTLLSKGAWQQVTGIEDLCHAQVSHKWLCHLDARAGSVLTRLHHQCSENSRQQCLGGRWPVRMLRFLPGPTVGTRRHLLQPQATQRHYARVHAVVCGMKLADRVRRKLRGYIAHGCWEYCAHGGNAEVQQHW